MRPRRTIAVVPLAVVALAGLGLAPAAAAPPGGDLPIDPPVAGAEVPRGTWSVAPADAKPPVPRSVDGRLDDWVGASTGYAGTVVHDAGELIYTDHLFDAYGPDDGADAQRRALLGPVEDRIGEAYRIEAAINADLPGQFGAPAIPGIDMSANYGDLDHQHAADLVEVRLGADSRALWLVARTAQLTAVDQTGVLMLLDNDGRANESRQVPFGAGITTERADLAVLLVGNGGKVADLATGAVHDLPRGTVATNPDGFTNAVEAALPMGLVASDDVAIALAAGPWDADAQTFADGGLGANLANVAFRTAEPVREWMDQQQALALHDSTIDPFFLDVDLTDLRAGRTDRFEIGPGYHERLFASTTPGLAQEEGREGLFQHYGVYLPSSFADLGETRTVLPLQLWLHWRGGTAHAAAALGPGIFRHMGEDRDGIVVSPRGRGTSTWYVGRGHADILEVLADVEATLPVDHDRTYVSGHSMGGWGSYLLSILYPDRFAAALPVAGPVTQGAWTGLDLPGCDDLRVDDYSACYIEANGGRARDQHTRRMLDNLRNVPIGMFYAGADELVPVTGALRQHERLVELGYRHRMFIFPAHEHYTHPIVDEWAAGVRYLDQFERDENPAHVTYVRDRAFEAAVNEVGAGDLDADWRFDRAYWMSALEVADGADRARFDGRTLAYGPDRPTVVPDADLPTSPNQTGPYTVTGLRWIEDPLAAAGWINAFELDLAGTSGVRLDVDRMDLDTNRELAATITSDHEVTLHLEGRWRPRVHVVVDGRTHDVQRRGDTLTITLPAGEHDLRIQPHARPWWWNR